MTSNETREKYCGDGVYATWNGESMVLDLRKQAHIPNPTCRIVLEHKVFHKMATFWNRCVDQDKARREAERKLKRGDA